MYIKQFSNYSNTMFAAELPVGWVLHPPEIGEPPVELTKEEFDGLDKTEEEAGIIIDDKRVSIYTVKK